MSEHYAGRVRETLSLSGLRLFEATYAEGLEVDRHVHGHPLVVLVTAGVQTERAAGRRLDCRAGTVLFHPPGEPHTNHFGDQGARCLILEFREEWLRRVGQGSEMIPDRPAARLGESVTTAGRLLHREFRRGETAHPATLDGLALTLLAALAREEEPAPEGRPEYLDRVLERLHDDLASDPGLSSLAGIAGVSPEHLARSFREHMDCTVGEYVRRLRVRRARRALAEGDEPLSSLALRLGFYDQPHFTRTFKAHVGCPPGEYRRRQLE